MDELSDTSTAPLKKWVEEGMVFKFWGDNVDKCVSHAPTWQERSFSS